MFFAAALNFWCLLLSPVFAQPTHSGSTIGIEPDWSANATIDHSLLPFGRANIYQWDETTLPEKIAQGQKHALHYPVVPTGLLIPARPALKILEAKPGEPLFKLMKAIFTFSDDFTDFKGFWEWLGLTPPKEGSGEKYPMGVSIIARNGAEGFTLSCAACHSSELFGKQILGMTNRFSRANLFFAHGQHAMDKISPTTFRIVTGSTRAEKEMYRISAERVRSVGLKKPAALGLDTSLAQVALSLAKRAQTPNAERTEEDAKNPRTTILNEIVADSKPAVWWNVKYKTRWLSDGSVRTGNPVFTNFLWNEIGRGVDLPELIAWLQDNNNIVQELTTAVFATEAPKWKDFFGENSIHIERAKRGEKIYEQSCAKCHGSYEKAWNLSETPLIADTIRVKYDSQTKVHDVGTDPGRRQGMRALADGLNPLAFSKTYNIVIEEQPGYVAPPLVGIWARYPYFHNNSIPNLCALMTPPDQRPKEYFSGKAIDRDRDYDQDCLGYPVGAKTPAEWKDEDHHFDTTQAGLSNSGHYRMFLNKDGTEKYTNEQKADLREFLKTL